MLAEGRNAGLCTSFGAVRATYPPYTLAMYAVISLTEIFPLESTSTVLKAAVSPASLLSMFSPKIDWKAVAAPRVFSVWLSPAWPSSLALLATALVVSAVATRPPLTAPAVVLVVDLVTSTVALVAFPTQLLTESMMFAIVRAPTCAMGDGRMSVNIYVKKRRGSIRGKRTKRRIIPD
jgi:hypothetical protein